MRIFIPVIFLLCSCGNSIRPLRPDSLSALNSDSLENAEDLRRPDLHWDSLNRLTKSDIAGIVYETLFPGGAFFREVNLGLCHGYQIGKNNVDTLLDYRFGDISGAMVIPWLEEADANTIILNRSCGSACGAIRIFSLGKDSIYDRGEFENPIAIDVKTFRVAFTDLTKWQVNVLNYKTGKREIISVPFERGEYGLDEYEGTFSGGYITVRDAEHRNRIRIKLDSL